MVEYAVAEDVVPRIGEEPETRRHMRAHRRAFGPRCPFALTALHFLPHPFVHLLHRDVAYSLLGHGLLVLSFTGGVPPFRSIIPPLGSWMVCRGLRPVPWRSRQSAC